LDTLDFGRKNPLNHYEDQDPTSIRLCCSIMLEVLPSRICQIYMTSFWDHDGYSLWAD